MKRFYEDYIGVILHPFLSLEVHTEIEDEH
jgi:hypothetical protein